MTSRPASKTRRAFTLLEMMLAASITVLLLAALYVAVDIQLRHAATARDLVEQTTLARTLVNRIANDIEPSVHSRPIATSRCRPVRRLRRLRAAGGSGQRHDGHPIDRRHDTHDRRHHHRGEARNHDRRHHGTGPRSPPQSSATGTTTGPPACLLAARDDRHPDDLAEPGALRPERSE